jgi:arginyl-tRNA--protein-N-Asp/Glu arginylyltransferase
MRVIARHIEDPRQCSYLPEERARLESFLLDDVSPVELEALLVRGFRRFGPSYFRPRCATCFSCDSIRVHTSAFKPSKSQRRAARNAARFTRTVSAPLVDRARVDLYRKWHDARQDARGWDPNPMELEDYAIHFAWPHPSAREVAFHDGEKLIGLGLWDVTPNAASAVFFFFDPDYAADSLGIANVVTGIEQAQREGRAYVYLGYRVAGCASLEYKGRFEPHEILIGRPSLEGEPVWRRVDDS